MFEIFGDAFFDNGLFLFPGFAVFFTGFFLSSLWLRIGAQNLSVKSADGVLLNVRLSAFISSSLSFLM